MTLQVANIDGLRKDPILYEAIRKIAQQAISDVDANGRFVRQDGTTELTVDWDAGDFAINSQNSVSWVNGVTRGMRNDGSFDNTSAFNDIIAWMGLNKKYVLYLPAGTYYFNSKPNAMTYGIWLLGDTMGGGTQIIRNYTEATAANGLFTWDGSGIVAGIRENGGGMTDLGVYAGGGTTGGCAIKLIGTTTTFRAGFMKFDNVIVSAAGSGTWFRSMFVDGSAMAGAGQGIRDISLRNVYLFKNTDSGNTLYLDNAVQFSMYGGGTYVPGAGNSGINVTGANSANGHSVNVSFHGVKVTGPGVFSTDWADHVYGTVSVDGTVSIGANTSDAIIAGTATSTVTNAGTRTVTLIPGVGQPVLWVRQATGNSRDILFESSSTKAARFGIDTSDNAYAGSINATPYSVKTNGVIRQHYDTGGNTVVGNNSGTIPSKLTVTENTADLPAQIQAGTVIQGGAADAAVTRAQLDSFGAANAFSGRRANGTNGSKTGVVANDPLAQLTGSGYTSAGAYSSVQADVRLLANETWSGTIQGSYAIIRTTQNGGTTLAEKLRVGDDGKLTQTLLGLSLITPGVMFTQTADSATTANTLTTLLGTGVGTLTLPANLLIAGRAVRVTLSGYVSVADGGAGTKTLTVALGGTTVATGTSGATFTTLVNQEWLCDVLITCRTAGAPGTVQASGRWYTQIAANGGSSGVFAASNATTNITTTGTLAVNVSFNNGNATGTVTTTNAVLEVLG